MTIEERIEHIQKELNELTKQVKEAKEIIPDFTCELYDIKFAIHHIQDYIKDTILIDLDNELKDALKFIGK